MHLRLLGDVVVACLGEFAVYIVNGVLMCGASEDAIAFGIGVGETGEVVDSFEEGVEGYLGGEGFLGCWLWERKEMQ